MMTIETMLARASAQQAAESESADAGRERQPYRGLHRRRRPLPDSSPDSSPKARA
ncbi:hypothetical protein ACQPYK_38315 [Streptosporangium sp. CA-135522]|uniref:hypothetical protein n=1 Tax=Streptosporangium sp. CA-135522 TaxID=3240072 RepID=UPI003D8B4070